MNAHLTDQELNAYLHQTLNDAQRETLDAHLTGCPTCRAHLSELNVLQQRVRRELTAELKAANVPLSLMFEAIAPQLNPRKFLVFRQFAVRMTAAATVTALLLVLVILASNPQPTPTSTTSVLVANQVVDFAALGANVTTAGWFLDGSAPQKYETGVDQIVTHDGRSSGYIRSTAFSPEDFGTLMQMFKADDYRGKRLRLSAYVKTDQVKNWVGLWMRVDGPGSEVLAFDNMQNRPIRGTTDWQPVATILDVPQNSTGIAFGILLQGPGRVWIDNVQFEVVGQDVSTTQLKEDATPPIPQPINLDFEAGLNGWTPESTSQDYATNIDPTVAHSGQASGHIQSQQANPAGVAALSQYVEANDYRGKRVRITEYIKFDGSSTAARFVVYAFGPANTALQSNSQPLYSTAQWQKRETVLYVPENSERIAYGVVLEGRGQIWIDDVQLETIDSQLLSSPADQSIEPQPINLDFETSGTGWSTAGSSTLEYVSGIDPAVAHLGQASGSIAALGDHPNGLGLLRQSIKADEYRGKRVRVSGYLKDSQLASGTALLVSVYGQQDQTIYGNSQWIGAATDWQWFGLVFDVPANSDRLEYGLALMGPGQAWIDDVSIEVVGDEVETSSVQASPLQYRGLGYNQLENADFESSPNLQSWFKSGNADYEDGIDHSVFHTGNSSAYLKSRQLFNTDSFEALSQIVSAKNYRGKRLRLSGFVKANQVEGWAGLWMNIVGSSNQPLGSDNMQNRPITGTADWQKYEIVLDVPESDSNMMIIVGTLLQGKGQIWLDDVNLEIVGQDVPTTSPYQQQPLNLNFENKDQNAPSPSNTPPLAHFGNVATLTDARWSPDELKPGESLKLSLHWIVSTTKPVTLNTFVHVVDLQGNIIAQADQPLTDVGTSVQTVTLQPPTSLVSGTYQIVTGVYDSTTFKRLTIDEDKLGVQLTVFIVGTITADPLHWPQEKRFGDVATLVNTSLSDTRFKPGDTLTLDLSWDISRAEGYTSFVHVLDAQDQVVAQADLSLESIKARNVRGQPNVPYLIGQSKIQLPADLADGEYHLAVGIYDDQTGQRVTNNLGQTAVMIASFEVGPDLIITSDTKHVHLVNLPKGYVPPVESHFEIAIRNACADLGCEIQPMTCVGSSCSPYSPALTVTVYVDPKATALYGWMNDDQLMFKIPSPGITQTVQSVFDVPDSLTLLVEKVARSVYGWPPQTMSGLPIFSGIVDWETYQLDQRLGSAKLSNPFQPDRLAGTTLSPLESLWVPGSIVSETREMQAEAAALVAFVEQEFGAPAIGKLLKSIGSAHSLPEAIESGLNIKYTDFEQRWRDWLAQYDAN